MNKVEQILTERESTHGNVEINWGISQTLKRVMHSTHGYERLSNVHREALEMICHKIARVLAGNPNFVDHWDDIAGYATLVSKHIELKEKQNEQLSKIS